MPIRLFFAIMHLSVLVASLLLPASLPAQTAPAIYWVQFTDKDHTPYSLSAPQDYLSQRALDRRARQNIPVDSLDLPVDPAYIAQLLAAGQIELLNVSKWFNAVTIRSTDTLALDSLGLLPFVHQLRMTMDGKPRPTRFAQKFGTGTKTFQQDYGSSFRQIEMMNGHLLHEAGGAKGQGMLIGVLDSGFQDADILPGLSDLRGRNGITLTRDLVEPGGNVYAEHYHGRSVLSLMAGHVDGKLTGTAPLANYVLVRTENVESEYLVEEDNWVSGAELCDSIGCDVLNTSLGYTTFDDSTQDHTYADLNGLTSRMTLAADIAARKGMIPVNSAGNSGTLPWHYISAPADAFDILAVGAVGSDRMLADFSSRGPSADGRVKPDVSAMGLGTIGIGTGGYNVYGINGTSFSSPLVAGLAACLWQLHPDRSAHDIMDAVRRSASQYDHPDGDLGHGIPDFWRAHLLLGGRDITNLTNATAFQVIPVPFTNFLDIEVFAGDETGMNVLIYDMLGRELWSTTTGLEPHTYSRVRIQNDLLTHLRAGAYIVKVQVGGSKLTQRVIKAG
ncbi:MAG: S8 family peptidase [Flavobacteriales bacterium]|jgi:subtilisin family serine protease|nr:S8 family peptidase [Flavobacteriales bacterium]MCB0759689.1 S8 family peptidase [Flavobacteriales bacterium]